MTNSNEESFTLEIEHDPERPFIDPDVNLVGRRVDGDYFEDGKRNIVLSPNVLSDEQRAEIGEQLTQTVATAIEISMLLSSQTIINPKKSDIVKTARRIVSGALSEKARELNINVQLKPKEQTSQTSIEKGA